MSKVSVVATVLSAIVLFIYPIAIHFAIWFPFVACVAVVTQVIVEFGIVITLSCVGSVAVKVVSYASAVAPSNIMPEAPICIPDVDVPDANVIVLIVGLVKVLFVNVFEPANVAKLSLCNALLNSATEPVQVFDPKSKVLFVNVSVVALPISVSVALG